MNKKLKIFIIIGSILIVGVIGYFIYKSYVNFIGDDVEAFNAEYREDTYVDDFVFMNATLNENDDNYYIFSVMVKNIGDKDYDIDSIEIDFYNTKDRKIGSMLYIMEEDKFYHDLTIAVLLGKNINLKRSNSIKYKINYK